MISSPGMARMISSPGMLGVWENNQLPLKSAAREAISTFHDLIPKVSLPHSSLFSYNDFHVCVCVCVCVCTVLCLVTQSCLTICEPWTVACQAPLSIAILQARILDWVAMPSSRGSFQSRNQNQGSHIAGGSGKPNTGVGILYKIN